MKIILNGRKVGKHNIALYYENKAYFTKEGLKKRTVLHEVYHHLVEVKGYELKDRIEEKEANNYAREFLKCNSVYTNRSFAYSQRFHDSNF